MKWHTRTVRNGNPAEFVARIRFRWTVETGKDEQLRLRFAADKITVDEVTGQSAVSESAPLMKRLIVNQVFESSGLKVSVTSEWPDGHPVETVIDIVHSLFRCVPLPFPRQAVGKSATWEVERPSCFMGEIHPQVCTFRLDSVIGRTGTVGLTLRKISLAPSRANDVSSLEFSGRGTATFNISELVPRIDLSLQWNYVAASDGLRESMVTRVSLEPQ